MKNILSVLFIFTLCFAVSASLYAQGRRIPFCGFNGNTGFYGKQYKKSYIVRESKPGDDSGIYDVVQEIKKALGINVKFEVYISNNEDNCYATIGEGGKRMIVADHHFLNKVNKNSGTQWAAISILAHEVGHHVAGFNRNANPLDDELDADYWSGYVLQHLGAGREAAVKCILTYGTDSDTDSHPNKHARARTIKAGWDDAFNGHIDYSRCENCD